MRRLRACSLFVTGNHQVIGNRIGIELDMVCLFIYSFRGIISYKYLKVSGNAKRAETNTRSEFVPSEEQKTSPEIIRRPIRRDDWETQVNSLLCFPTHRKHSPYVVGWLAPYVSINHQPINVFFSHLDSQNAKPSRPMR